MSPRFGAGGPLTSSPGVIDEGLEVLTEDEFRTPDTAQGATSLAAPND
jgi:hypothetical protein